MMDLGGILSGLMMAVGAAIGLGILVVGPGLPGRRNRQ